MEIRNARITNTMLGREDHGILTFMIFVEIADNGGSCGIGGYALDCYDKEKDCRIYSAKSIEIISHILEVVGVDKWEDLKGRYIRVKDNGWGEVINEIGHPMKNKWLNLREFFKCPNE